MLFLWQRDKHRVMVICGAAKEGNALLVDVRNLKSQNLSVKLL